MDFAGHGVRRLIHIVANCQQLQLAMSRDDFVDTGPGRVYSEVVSALQLFVNALRRGQPFRYRGRTIETGSRFAGACFVRLKALRNSEAQVQREQMKALSLLMLSESSLHAGGGDGGPVLAPVDPVGVLLFFQSLVTKHKKLTLLNRPSNRVEFRILGYTGGPQDFLVVQKRASGSWSGPLFYKPCLSLTHMDETDLAGADGVVCWGSGNSPATLPESIDVLVLDPFAQN